VGATAGAEPIAFGVRRVALGAIRPTGRRGSAASVQQSWVLGRRSTYNEVGHGMGEAASNVWTCEGPRPCGEVGQGRGSWNRRRDAHLSMAGYTWIIIIIWHGISAA
jgi:hypothetical protein